MRRRFMVSMVPFWVTVLAILPSSCFAADCAMPRQHHGWGRFNEGSWRQVQIVTESLDERGTLTRRTTTESTSTLVEVSDHDYAVKVDTVVNVAGKQFSSPAQIVRRGFYGQPEGQTAEVRRVGKESVRIRDQEIPSEIQQVVLKGVDAEQMVTVHYSDCISPYVLRREAKLMDASGRIASATTQTNTIDVNVPRKVLTELKPTSQVKTIQRSARGTSVTVEVHCLDVPGGVVRQVTKEYDPSGRLVRINTLRLLAYGTVERQVVQSPPLRRRFFRRRIR